MRTPATNVVAVLSISVGIGCAAAAFCVADPVFLRPLPYAQPNTLFSLKLTPEPNGIAGRLNLADFSALKALPDVRVAAFQPSARGRLRGQNEPIRSMAVTWGFFDVLGVPLARGRVFTQDEHQAGSPVCLLAHEVAEAVFGRASNAVGESVVLEDLRPRAFTVVGVLPPGFLFPDTRVAPGMIVPISDGGQSVGTIVGDVQIVARLMPEANSASLTGQLRQIAASSEAQYPKLDRGRQTMVSSLADDLFGEVRQPTLVIFVAVLSIALLGCANLYHILAIQLRRRSRDLGVATALGATRRRLVAGLAVERAIIAIVGAGGALLIAQLLRVYLIGELPEALAVLGASAEPINGRVIAFVLAAAFASAALAAFHPIWQLVRALDRQEWLKDRSASRTRSGRRADGMLIVSQSMATFLVLMISLTVLRSLFAIGNQPMGFDYGALRIVQPLPAPAYFADLSSSRAHATRAAYDRLKTRFGSAVAANVGFPTGSTAGVVVAGESVDEVEVPYYAVSGDFFGVSGLRLVAGHTFDESESLIRGEKAVVDEVAAQKLWPGTSPLGRLVEASGESRRYQVIGVVRGIGRDLLQAQAPRGAVFLPIEDRWGGIPMISFRASRDVRVPEMAAVIESELPGVFVSDEPFRPFRVQFARHEFLTALIGTIAALNLIIVVVGVWSLNVHQLHAERRDLAVRMALGAEPAAVVNMILVWRVLVPVGLGIALGAVTYLPFAGRVAELSFKTPAVDVTSLAVSTLVVVTAAVLPMIVPSLRLARDQELLRELR